VGKTNLEIGNQFEAQRADVVVDDRFDNHLFTDSPVNCPLSSMILGCHRDEGKTKTHRILVLRKPRKKTFIGPFQNPILRRDNAPRKLEWNGNNSERSVDSSGHGVGVESCDWIR
jgi:hypothetical protein